MVAQFQCGRAMGAWLEDGHICAGGVAGKDSCQVRLGMLKGSPESRQKRKLLLGILYFWPYAWQGDSGGPLTYNSNGQHILIGDVSFGDGCAEVRVRSFSMSWSSSLMSCLLQDGKYGIYGRISHFRSWIEEKMTSPKYCRGGANAEPNLDLLKKALLDWHWVPYLS